MNPDEKSVLVLTTKIDNCNLYFKICLFQYVYLYCTYYFKFDRFTATRPLKCFKNMGFFFTPQINYSPDKFILNIMSPPFHYVSTVYIISLYSFTFFKYFSLFLMINLYVILFKINTAPTFLITCLSIVRPDHHHSISKQRKKILQNNLPN